MSSCSYFSVASSADTEEDGQPSLSPMAVPLFPVEPLFGATNRFCQKYSMKDPLHIESSFNICPDFRLVGNIFFLNALHIDKITEMVPSH